MNARASNLYLRAGVVLVMALFLGAPSPGHISGCSATSGSVSGEEYCRGYYARVCERDFAARRTDEAGRDECRAQIETMCSGVTFPVGCSPSVATVQACFDALTDLARIGTPENMLPECRVCGGGSEGI